MDTESLLKFMNILNNLIEHNPDLKVLPDIEKVCLLNSMALSMHENIKSQNEAWAISLMVKRMLEDR